MRRRFSDDLRLSLWRLSLLLSLLLLELGFEVFMRMWSEWMSAEWESLRLEYSLETHAPEGDSRSRRKETGYTGYRGADKLKKFGEWPIPTHKITARHNLQGGIEV